MNSKEKIKRLEEHIKVLEKQLEDTFELPHTDDRFCWCQPTVDGSLVLHNTTLSLAERLVEVTESRDRWKNTAAKLSINLVLKGEWAAAWKEKAKLTRKMLMMTEDILDSMNSEVIEAGMSMDVIVERSEDDLCNELVGFKWVNKRAEEAEAKLAQASVDAHSGETETPWRKFVRKATGLFR